MQDVPGLERDALLAEASARTGGLQDFGDRQFLEPLAILLRSLEQEAHLTAIGRMIARERVLGHLVNRLLFVRDRAQYPAIAQEKIVQPVFIIGLPRTGTTILHDILAQDLANRVPMTWECMFPSPPPQRASFETDARIARCEAVLAPVDAAMPGFRAMHPMGARLSQECVTLMADSFCSPLFHNQFRVPAYQDWMDHADAGPAYAFHFRQLQHFQWHCPGERWVLKTGGHMWGLEYLLQVYPDARIVFTHRDPVKSMTSYASLTTLVRSMSSLRVDGPEIARDWTPRLLHAVNHALEVRNSGHYPRARFYDMYFSDFIFDQFREVQRIYAALGLEMTAQAAARMRAFVDDNPPGKHGVHAYTAAQYGIDPAAVRRDFAGYIERFHLAPEPEAASRTPSAPVTMQAWRTHAYGAPLEALKLDEVPVPVPGPGELRIRVQAIPLNLNDLERITGGNMMIEVPLPYSPGMEVMGVVDECGAGTEAWVGKRVVATTKNAVGGYAQYAICPPAGTFEMPADIALPDAAALYFPFHLAWMGLHDRAALQAGEVVLIHAAAGGAGSAAIQVAVAAGARVIATVGSEEKMALCRRLGAELVLNYTATDFSPAVLEHTQMRGVDVVFDNVGEAVMEKSMSCLAYNGRYLMMGFASDKRVADRPFIVPRRVALGNMQLCGVLLAYVDDALVPHIKKARGWNFASHSRGAEIHAHILAGVRAGKLAAVIGQTAPFAQIPAAIDAMGKRATTGRTVVTL